jgi:hypothetical protein
VVLVPLFQSEIAPPSTRGFVTSMKELHDERLDIPVLSVCSVVCDVQMIEVIRKESMVTALDPMRLDFILTDSR